MTLNTFEAYSDSKQRLALKKHTATDEALVATWEIGTKLIDAAKVLTADYDANKLLLDAALAQIRTLTSRNDILESRNQVVAPTLADMLRTKPEAKSQA